MLTKVVDGAVEAQRLDPMAEPLTQQFRAAAQRALEEGAKRTRVAYRRGRKPDSHEVVTVASVDVPELTVALSVLEVFDGLPTYDPNSRFARRVALYLVDVDLNDGAKAQFLRATSFRRRLTTTKKIPAIWRGQVFELLEDDPVLFDSTFDAYVADGTVYMLNQRDFERSLNFLAEARKAAKETVSKAVAKLHIQNLNEFLDAVATDINMISKARGIAERLTDPAYSVRMTTAHLRDISAAHPELDIDWDESDPSAPKLVFHNDLERRWRILKLLDDDYVQSLVTELIYESNSKQSLS